jgi:protein required for attachment to host cells
MKPIVTWVLSIDRKQARILETRGKDTGLVQLRGHAYKAEENSGYSDDEGRTMVSQTKARTRLDKHVEQSPESLIFAGDMVAVLQAAKRNEEFDRLVICAAPQMLGILRNLWTQELQSTIKAELDKELVNVPTDKLFPHLAGVLSM